MANWTGKQIGQLTPRRYLSNPVLAFRSLPSLAFIIFLGGPSQVQAFVLIWKKASKPLRAA